MSPDPIPAGLTPLSPALRAHLTTILPPSLLPDLLTTRTTATAPRNPRITAASRDTLLLEFEHPVREYWLNAPTLRVALALGGLPEPPASSDSPSSPSADNPEPDAPALTPAELSYAPHLASLLPHLLAASAPPRIRTLPPPPRTAWPSIALFLLWTGLIALRIAGAADVFGEERWFNVAVCAHAVVLVRRSADVRRMGEAMGESWDGGWWRGWGWWGLAWVEGGRAVGRFLAEVERVRREEGKEGGKEGKGEKEKGEKGEKEKGEKEKGEKEE